MTASDEEDSEFERFLQASLSSSSASNQSNQNVSQLKNVGVAGKGRGHSSYVPTSLSNQWLEEEEEALKWLKPTHRDGVPVTRESTGEGGGLKLKVSVPNTSLGTGAGGESISVTNNSDEFSKDSVEVSLDKTPTSTTTRPRIGDFQDTTATALLDQSSHSFVVDQSSRSLTGDDVTPRQSGSSESETETSEGESPVIKAGNELKLSPSPKQSAAQTISPLSEFTPVIKTINEAEAVKPLAKQWEIKLNTSQSTHGTACSKDRDLSPPIHSHSLTSSGISTTMSVKQLEQSRLTEKSIRNTSFSSEDLVSVDDGVCGRSEGEHELMKDGWGEEDGDITQGGKMTSCKHVDMEGVEDYKDEESFPHIPSIDSKPHTPNINNDIKSVGNLTSKHSESETITLSLPQMIVETNTVHSATQSTMPHNSDLNIMKDLSDDVCTTQHPPILTTPSNIETSPDRGGDITNKTADIQQMSSTDVPLHNTPSLLLVQTTPSTESLQSPTTGAKSRPSIDRIGSYDYKITTTMSPQPSSQTPTTVIDIHPPVTDNTHNVSCGGFLSIGGGERDSDAGDGVDRMGESCEQYDSERLESEKVLSTQASEAHSVDDEVVNGVVMLEEAGNELERGLDELQQALDAAGLPGIHSNRQFNTHSNGRKNHGTSQRVLTLQDHSHSQQHMLDSRSQDTRTKTNRKEEKNILKDEKLSISKQSSRLTDGENDGMDATLRALATEELTSITKDLMYRERRKESARRQNSESKTSLTTSKTRLTTDKTRLTTNKTSSLSHKTGLGHQKTSVTSSIPSFKSGRPISGSSSTSRKFCGRKLEPSTKDRVYGGRVSRREQDSDDGSHGDGDSSHGDGSHGDGGSKGERIELETPLQNETESVATEKVQKYKLKQSLWQHVKVGGAITEGEMKELKSSILEQESLIDGYQKENERLYAELKEVKHSLRLTKEQLTTDTQRLRTELANTRAQLELKPSQNKAATSTSTNQTTSNNNDIIRITQLEDQLERSRDECRNLERQVVQLKHSLHVTEHRTSLSRNNTIHKGTQTEGEEGREDGELRDKEAEIALLKDKLLAIQRRGVRKKASHTSSFDAERIQQLERQVRGLNDIIKRRFPNSLSALIIAAESSSSQTKTSDVNKKKMVTGSTQSASRVREIEEEVKRKEEKNKTKIEALHQKYTSMKIYYEEQLSSLRERLKTEERKNTAAIDLKKKENEPSERERGGSEREEEMQLPQSSPRRMTSEVVSSPTATRPEETIRTKEENVFLRQQLSSLQLEWEHQRLKLQSQLVEAEAASRTAREETAAELSSLRQRHVTEVDRLKAQFARHHSQSETATLKTNLSSLQVECHLMKERLKMAENEREELRAAKENEEVLTRQIKQLSKQLVEAKKHHTPEMHHYSSLLAKITTLETRIAESESTTSQRMVRLRRPITDQMKQIELKWQRVVQSKDEEIAQFRVEMDTILQTLHALQINPSPYTS